MRPIDADKLEIDMMHEYNTFPSRPEFGTMKRFPGVSIQQIMKAPTIDASKIIPTDVLMNLLEAWLDLNPKKVIIVTKVDTTAGTRHKITIEEVWPVNKETIEKLKERMNNHDQT